jgi:histidinol-phosphatase (PHP family)
MITADYHMHTLYCDGHSTPREMVESALAMGLSEIGFSAHSYTPFDESYCIPKNKIEAYAGEIAALKSEYAGRIRILFGFEQDYYSDPPPVPVDYLIGSVHYIKCGDTYIPADEGNKKLQTAADLGFGGDLYAMAEEYFRTEADVVRRTGCDIIGHFDTITKYFEREPLLDTSHPRYRAAWQAAADALLKTGVPFEINTGTISRGVRRTPLPNEEIRRYIAVHGGVAILSSDAHRAENIAFQFDCCEADAARIGLRLISKLDK